MGLLERLIFGQNSAEDSTLTAFQTTLNGIDVWNIPSVVGARQLVADTVSSFPMVAISETTGALLPGQAARPDLLRRPDPRRPYKRTIEAMINAWTRYGTAWFYIPRAMRNSATGVPASVQFVRNGRVTYQLSKSGQSLASAALDGRNVAAGELVPVPFISEDDSPIGVSPLNQIYPALENLRHCFAFAADYYGSGAAPPYIIRHKTRLTEEKRKEYLDQWAEGRGRNRVALISGDVDLQTFQPTNAAEAALWEAVRYLDQQVARVMQIPPDILNAMTESTSTYGNVRDQFRRFLALGLAPTFLDRVETQFTEWLPKGVAAQMITASLTRAEQAERVQTAATGLASGVFDQDQARAVASETNPLVGLEVERQETRELNP